MFGRSSLIVLVWIDGAPDSSTCLRICAAFTGEPGDVASADPMSAPLLLGMAVVSGGSASAIVGRELGFTLRSFGAVGPLSRGVYGNEGKSMD